MPYKDRMRDREWHREKMKANRHGVTVTPVTPEEDVTPIVTPATSGSLLHPGPSVTPEPLHPVTPMSDWDYINAQIQASTGGIPWSKAAEPVSAVALRPFTPVPKPGKR